MKLATWLRRTSKLAIPKSGEFFLLSPRIASMYGIENHTKKEKGPMATLDAERILNDWATAWSSHDTERVLALFTDDCVYEDVTFGAVNHGKAELRAFADGTFAAIPDFKVTVINRFIAGSCAGIEWVMSGTHKGDFPGLPATGKSFSSVRGATIVELETGKIRRCSDYWDAANVMRQVGLLTAL
jgi:steroid delta-isomerase-like uncharacterized protein